MTMIFPAFISALFAALILTPLAKLLATKLNIQCSIGRL